MLVANPGTGLYVDKDRMVVRNLEVPSGGGVGSAHAIAKAYGVFASGGRERGLNPETIEALKAPAVPSRHGFFDKCLRVSAQFSLGVHEAQRDGPFGHAPFGAPGPGGSITTRPDRPCDLRIQGSW